MKIDINPTTALDLRTEVPRSGRDMLGGFAWLGRMIDKARAKQAGTLGDYISLCPFDKGFLARTHVSEDTFVDMIRGGLSDAEFVEYFQREVSAADRDSANEWVLKDQASHLDEQDAEEGRKA
ncbi:MAG: DUF5069 domain-containing protein [Candidatus Eremiobacteraeota bacterium]|nr:DUF5069 domain-containing protein [Candidatus Eremiobacteraeota bacterium]